MITEIWCGSFKVVENGEPNELLQIADGYFRSMMDSGQSTSDE